MKKTVTLSCLLPFPTETGAGAGDAKTTAAAIVTAVHDFCERRRAAPDPDNFPLEPLRDADLKYPSIRVGFDAADAAVLKEISEGYKSVTQGRVVAWIVAASAWGQRVTAENRAAEETALRREQEITLFKSLSARRDSERARDEALAKRAAEFADKVAARAGVDFIRVSPASDKPGAIVRFDFDPGTHEDFRAAFQTARWRSVERVWFIPGSTAVDRARRWAGSLSDREKGAVDEARHGAIQNFFACERVKAWTMSRGWHRDFGSLPFSVRDGDARREISFHIPWCKIRTPLVVDIAKRLPGATFHKGNKTWAWAPSTPDDIEALAAGLVEIDNLWRTITKDGVAAWEARKSEPKAIEPNEWLDEAVAWLAEKKARGGIWASLDLSDGIAPKRIEVSWFVPFLITPAVEDVLEKFKGGDGIVSVSRPSRHARPKRYVAQEYSVKIRIGSHDDFVRARDLFAEIEAVAPPVAAAPSAEEEQTYAERKNVWLADEDRPVHR